LRGFAAGGVASIETPPAGGGVFEVKRKMRDLPRASDRDKANLVEYLKSL